MEERKTCTNLRDYKEFKERIKIYSEEVIDNTKLEEAKKRDKFKEPFELKGRIGFPYRLDRNQDEESIMIMGINPAGAEVDNEDYLCIVPGCEFTSNEYGYNKYYDANYDLVKDLVKDLDIRLFWSSYDVNTELLEGKVLPGFKKVYEKETKKAGPYLVFSNIMYIHETNSENLKYILKKDKELKMKLKQLLEEQIIYYNPKYIIVTNAWVSERIHEIYEIDDVKTNAVINGVHFIFSGFVSSGRLDKYNTIRLKEEIHRIFKVSTRNY